MKKVTKTVLNGCGKVIDDATGKEIELKSNNYRITIKEFLEEDDSSNSNGGRFMDDVTFIKSFRGNGIILNQELTNAEIAVVVFLCDFICYNDCVLRKNGNKRGNPLTVRDLSELIGMKYETFRKTMSSLKKKQVIGQHSTGDSDNGTLIKWITVNPFIFCRGIEVDGWVADFYANSEWAKIERQKMKKAKKDSLEIE